MPSLEIGGLVNRYCSQRLLKAWLSFSGVVSGKPVIMTFFLLL